MAFIEAPTNFYLGRTFNARQDKLGDDVVYYDSRDLVTHALVVGMTGSGKTGLCITLLEEAILDNIPAIILDPKGDITNLMLTFPDLRPEDFQPWVHADDARRAGMDQQNYAQDLAQRWRSGLAKWGIVPDRLRWLDRASQKSIYTPGSDAGLPISILASLRAPRRGFAGQEEALRENINGVTTALLALAGISAEPVKDQEHVLISNIIEHNWRQGRDLTLEDIILQIKQPPFEKLGVFNVDQYMSEKKRYNLAMEINNILASPSFQTWLAGEPMDIQNLLYQPNGRPKVSIFYTAHLNDQERMFITTLLLESMLSWMRTLPGTTSLRAILYIDEMYGLFPPYPKNPATKDPLLRLLKQARAFGIGLVLATQNPGDLDYKGLSNMGTWFIGRLQSENDRKKVMSGLKEMAAAEEEMNLNDVENLIAEIKPRVFLMRNVHNQGGPLLLHSRWAMNYLAGPLTRQQISYLMSGQKQQLMQRLQQQGYYAQHPQQHALQSGYSQQAWTQQHTFGQNVPPPPPGFAPQGGYQQGGFGAQSAPPPPPGFAPQGGYQQGGYGAQSAPPPPPGFSQQGGYGYQQGGFGAQSVPQPPPGSTPTGGMPPINPDDSRAMPGGGGRLPEGWSTRQPAVKSTTQQFFLPTTLTSQQAFANYQQQSGQNIGGLGNIMLAYKPMLIAQATVRYQERKANIYTAREYAFHVPDLASTGFVKWEEYQAHVVDKNQVASEPFGQAIFGDLPPGLTDDRRLKALQGELKDMLYNTARLVIPHHAQFKLYGNPDQEMSEFQSQVVQRAREERDAEIDKLSQKYGDMMDKLEEKLKRKERELEAERLEIRDRRREQLYTTGEAVLSIFRGRTNYTLSRMSRATRMKRQTEADLQESREVLEEIEQEIVDLEQEYEQKLQEVNDRWGRIANDMQEHTITPYKKDIAMDLFGVGWVPHYYVQLGNQPLFIPAFG